MKTKMTAGILSALFVACLMFNMMPVSGRPRTESDEPDWLLKVVGTTHVATDGWVPVELPPGIPVPITDLSVMVDGLAHINFFIFPTEDPAMVKVDLHLFWHGDAGAQFYMDMDEDGICETWMEAIVSMKTAQIIAHGVIAVVSMEPLIIFPKDMLLNLIANGYVKLTIDGTTFEIRFKAHILLKIADGELAWVKMWAPE